MIIKPQESFRLLGTSIRLDSGKTYQAINATNQPDWESKGLVFVLVDGDIDGASFLLEKGEYEIV
jgi:hypothetical protein